MSKKQLKNESELEDLRDYYIDLYQRFGYRMKNGVRYGKLIYVLRGMLIEQILELRKLLKSKYLPKSDRRQVERTLANLISILIRTLQPNFL